MSADFSPELRKELLDDFYAECDELLTRSREGLASLEEGLLAHGRADESTVAGVHRSFHTLKGSAAIVGLRPAEMLAHAMEEVLRTLPQQPQPAAALRMLEELLASLQRFEQVIAAHRRQEPQPDVQDLVATLQASAAASPPSLVPLPATPADDAAAMPPVDETPATIRARGLQPWTCWFSPSAELQARGINLDVVRQRLKAAGDVIRVTPHVRGEGAIAFEFLVALRSAPPERAAWEQDGMRFEPGAEPEPAEADRVEAGALTPSHIVRVDLARLDDLMRIAGELVILRSRFDDRLNRGGDVAGLREINLAMARSLRDLRKAIERVRLVPIAELFSRMPFVVRDLARDAAKRVRVALEGRHTEIDKYIVERLREPLLHLVRNAFSHGIEPADERTAAGKPAEGTITLQAAQAGEFVVIKIRDDGRGVDIEAVKRRALAVGLPVPEPLDDAGVLGLLSASGFSTRDAADFTSGRGVGMSVVADTVRELGGSMTLSSARGAGTEFTLRLPLMLAITPAILVSTGDQRCAVPQGFVEEVVQIPAAKLRVIQRTEVVPYRDGLLPIVRLRQIFGQPAAAEPQLTLLVLTSDRGTTGLAVDRVQAQREIVVRPLTDQLVRVPYISGATELGDGRPVLVLDPAAVTRGAVRPVWHRESTLDLVS